MENRTSTSMTVQQVIDALLKIEDKTKLVSTEGCDCYGDVGRVTEDAEYVNLLRS